MMNERAETGARPSGELAPVTSFLESHKSFEHSLGGPSGQITCSAVGTSFEAYNTVVGASGCGTETEQAAGTPFEPIAFVPAVQLNG